MTGQPAATRHRQWRAGATTAFLATAAAAISYLDGLYLVHLAGAHGPAAYLYPLLPDGLIVVSFESTHDARQCGHSRPGWATAGLALGAVLTVGMNVAAGAGVKVPLALVDGVVPVVFFVALEILIGMIRRGRGSLSPMVTGDAPATSSQPEPPAPLTTEQALAALLDSASQRALHELLGVPRSRVQAWAARVAPVAEDVPAGAAVTPAPVTPAPAGTQSPPAGEGPPPPAGAELQPGLNGSGPHG
jgi:hypothetical protein